MSITHAASLADSALSTNSASSAVFSIKFTPPASARPDIALMAGYHSPQLDVELRMNTNESPYAPPAALTDAVVEAARAVNWNRYPDRQAAELRSRIAARHSVASECVFVANGSNEVLQSLLLAYGAAKRTVVIFEPTYAIHSHLARVTGSNLVSGHRGSDFTLDADHAVQMIENLRPSLTFLCSPNNPTGMTENPEVVAKVIESVRSVGGLLCVDEAYGEFAQQSALDLVDESLPLVVTRTYSKAWAMAAARLGYMIGPSWVVNELQKVVLPYHLDSVKQAAGIAALDYSDAMQTRVEALVAGRAQIVSGLSEMDVQVWPSGANFVLFRPLSRDGADVWRELVSRSVLVRDCSSWPHFKGCLRVTVGTQKENQQFLIVLSEIL